MKILVAYSTLTGNTEKVAAAIFKSLPAGTVLDKISPALETASYDLIFIGFWIDKNNAERSAADFLSKLHNKKVALFVTLGAAPNTPYAEKCLRNAANLIAESNSIIGSYHCQGKIDPKLIVSFKNLSDGQQQSPAPERLALYQAASSHPDYADLTAAAEFAKMVLRESIRYKHI